MPRVYEPRPWPYKAKESRDSAAEEVAAALKYTLPLMDLAGDPETLKRIARTINHLQNALRHLESAGAQTKPVP
jgi:hypothetical protein